MDDGEFIEGKIDTGYIARYNDRRMPSERPGKEQDIAILAAGLSFGSQQPSSVGLPVKNNLSRWVASVRPGFSDR